jgi:hypothetical protein
MDPKNPNGEIPETPDDSQSEITTADDGSQVNPQGAQDPSAEEVAFNSLKGSTQERIRTLANRANLASTAIEEVERLKQEMEALKLQRMAPAPNPDVQDAVSKLDTFGVATKSWSEKTIDEKVDQKLSGILYKLEMDRLEGKHGGSDGLPAFDRSEYEAFVNANPKYRAYDPEDVYQKMFEEEIQDAKFKGQGTRQPGKQPTLRPTRTRVQEEAMTPEYIEKRLQQPDGRTWYEQNRDKINAVVARVPSTE